MNGPAGGYPRTPYIAFDGLCDRARWEDNCPMPIMPAPTHQGVLVDGLDERSQKAVAEVAEKAREKFSGSITIHFKEGIAQQVETHTRKNLNKS